MSCDGITIKGLKCKNIRVRPNVYCKKHLPICSNLYNDYHQVCDKVWESKCTQQMSKSELKEIADDATQCSRLRSDFITNCCNGQTDRVHLGAIEKMIKLRDKCDLELNHLKLSLPPPLSPLPLLPPPLSPQPPPSPPPLFYNPKMRKINPAQFNLENNTPNKFYSIGSFLQE